MSDLRFNGAETAVLLNDGLGLDLAPDGVARLQGRTEGWAAGLCMAALSLQGRSDSSEFIRDFAGDDRHVVDYLGAEVLAGQPEDVRRFLLETSVLERLSGPLCDAARGTGGSADMLERIERHNLFLLPLDEKRRYYRYHHLFRDLLRHELQRTDPDLPRALHRRAARWLDAAGSRPRPSSTRRRPATRASRATSSSATGRTSSSAGSSRTVGGWLDGLPPGVIDADSRLCLIKAWLGVNEGRIHDIDRWVEAAERAAGSAPVPGERTSYGAAAGMLRCIHRYMEGDLGQAIEAARRAQATEPEEIAPWRSVGCPVLGIALFWRGQEAAGAGRRLEAIPPGRADNHLAVIHASGCVAAQHAELGDWEAADRLARTAIDIGRERGLEEHWANAIAHVARGRVLERQGDLDQAEGEVRLAVDLSTQGVAKAEIGYALLAYAEVRHRRGQHAEARELVRDARRAIESCPGPGCDQRSARQDGAAASSPRYSAARG